MTVDLSTLKVRDAIELRSGDIHVVTRIVPENTGYTVHTEMPREFQGEFDYKWFHMTTGHLLEDPLGDIIKIHPVASANTDPVNNPSHYTSGKIEVIDFIQDQGLGLCLGNSIKYISRAGKKDPSKRIEDIKKSIWYCQKQIEEWETEE